MNHPDTSFKITIPCAPTARLIIFKLSIVNNTLIINCLNKDKTSSSHIFKGYNSKDMALKANNLLVTHCAQWSKYLESNTGSYKNALFRYLEEKLE